MAEAIQGLSIGLGLDTAGIERGLKQIRPKLAQVNSEMKLSMSAFDRGEKSVDKYQTQIGGLTKKLGVQKEAVNAARTEYNRMVTAHGEGSVKAERASTVYNNQVATFNNLERHVEGLSDELRAFEEQQRIAASGWTRMSEGMEATGAKLTKFGGGMKSVGTGMSKYVTAPILGLGAAGILAANNLDEAYKTIRTGTGATGEALEDLKVNFKNVFENVPESAEEVSTALADLNTRTGLTGEPLEKLTEQFLTLGRVSGEEVPDLISKGTRAFGDWGISVDDQAGTMDYFWKVSQTTGIGVSDLMGKMVQFGAPLRQMGFDFETSAAMLGKFEKEGVNSELVMGSMRQALGKMAKEGIGAEEGLQRTMEAIKGAGSTSEANAAAIELFGARAGPDMAAAVREGRFEIEDLMLTLGQSEETIGKAGEETVTFGERMAVMKNKVTSSLEPIGDVLLDIADVWIPKLEVGIGKLTSWFEGLGEEGRESAVKFGMIAAAAGPVLVVLGSMATAAGGLITALAPVAAAIAGAGGLAASFGTVGGAVLAFATGPVGIAIAAIAGIGIGVGLLVNHFRKDAIPEVDRFGEGVSESTQKALGSFFELSDGASLSLMEMKVNGLDVTTEMAAGLVAKYEEMNGQILTGMKTRYAEENEEMKTYFANTSTLTEQEEAKIMMNKQKNQDKELGAQQLHEDQIQKILETAANEKRELTAGELAKIDKLHQEMNESAVVYLSENEMEQKVIMERMAATAGEMSALQAAEVTKNSAEARDKVIDDANTKYDETVAMAIRERDETGTITAEQATKIIAEATKTKDGAVKNAEEMHSGVVKEAKLQAGEHVDEVDWETGEILSKWDMYKKGVLEKFKETNEESLADFKRWGTDFDTGWTKFNNKSQEKVNAWKAGVKERMKESFADTKRDFGKWGSDFNTGWNNFNNKARAKVDEYKAGVKKRFKETNADSLADFRRWGGNIKDWAGDAKDSIMKTFDKLVSGAKKLPGRIGSGISSMASKVSDGVKKVSNKLASGLGTGVNGVIGGINWVLGKIGSKSKVPKWDIPEYAQGTHSHPGGMAILGDGRGSNAGRELIKTPSGEYGLSPGTDTLMNLPKGAQVLSAKKTRELLGDIPKYAYGIGDLWKDTKNLGSKAWGATKNAGSKVKDAAFDVWDHVSNPGKLLSTALSILGISAPTGGSFVGNMAKGGYNKVKSGATGYLKKQIDNSGTQAGSGQGFGPAFRLTSKRGFRINPVTGIGQMHQGDDWGARAGALIAAQAAGKVIESGFHSIRGNYVRVKSGAMDRLYQHNQRNMVSVGQNVRKGQAVGTVGSTGRSTGPHLHYEVRRNGKNINPAGLATGGVIDSEQLIRAGENGHQEIMIPMHPSRRTDAMKLLALAGKKLMPGGDKGITRPDQLPNVGGGSDGDGVLKSLLAATMKQNEILMQLLNKDANVYMDSAAVVGVIGDSINTQLGGSSRSNAYMRGERL